MSEANDAEYWHRLAVELSRMAADAQEREAQLRRALRGIIEMCHAALEQKA